jgi:hypothetical protein
MTHYPFAHRRYALLYPWSATLPTWTDFEFVNWHNPFDSPPSSVRLGTDAFADLTDMLTSSITSVERGIPANSIRARFDVKAASIPGGWSVSSGYSPFFITFKYWTQTATPTTPTTRPQRRNNSHAYAITAQVGGLFTMTNGTFSHTLTVGGNWGGFTSPTTGQFTTTDEVPTITRMGQNRYNEHAISRGSADLSSYSSTVSGFSSNVVRDHLVAMQTTLDAEIAAATVGIAYRIAAVLYGVSTAVTNSTGSESLENWVPITF